MNQRALPRKIDSFACQKRRLCVCVGCRLGTLWWFFDEDEVVGFPPTQAKQTLESIESDDLSSLAV